MSSELDIAIIGMSCRFPGANNIDEFWDNLIAGRESIEHFSREQLIHAGICPNVVDNPNYVKSRGIIRDGEKFDAQFFGYSPREAEIIDPQQRILLECAWEAIENAGYDSEKYTGTIGVFAGAATNHYIQNILEDSFYQTTVGPIQIGLGNEIDFLASRIAYKLNLQGIAIALQTACSTSLVAVHTACNYLLNYEVDMALAGGVSMRIPQTSGYMFQEEGILSHDGHCRAFDQEAAGTVSSNGAGMVLLKRFDDALRDQDHIYAVVKGTAVNNDGSMKAGFTAPSVEGQRKVVIAAHSVSQVDQIHYMEAHGSGTKLGDPIEFAALCQGYTTSIPQHCALGSVKTNLGHLNTAAGIASFIKTALVMYHRQVPPCLHFSKANPQIDLANSPFYINTQVVELPKEKALYSAVHSLGLGGTNAHAVLGTALPREKTSQALERNEIILLSAKSQEAVSKMCDNFSSRYELHDIAYTYRVGKRDFAHRCFAIGKTVGEVATQLQKQPQVFMANKEAKVAFLFCGVGEQYENMAQDLYHNIPQFREQMDHCNEIIRDQHGIHLLDILYSPHRKFDSEKPRTLDLQKMAAHCADDDALQQTLYAHLSLFVIEYALAKTLMRLQVIPRIVAGYSLGEITAACVSGVLSLEDSISLIIYRAKLIEKTAPAQMLAVLAGVHQLRLPVGVYLAIRHSEFLTIVAGADESIQRFMKDLDENNIVYRQVKNSRAVHTPFMAEICDELREFMMSLCLREPQIPIISNVDGKILCNEQVMSIEYWEKHLCEPVDFASCLEKINQQSDIICELGPGDSLTKLIRQQYDGAKIFSSMRSHYDSRYSDDFLFIRMLGQLWSCGVGIDWKILYPETRFRVPTPTYPFERKTFWVGKSQPYKDELPQAQRNINIGDDAVSQTLRGIWKELLAVENIHETDNFFYLGGHSLIAIQLIAKIIQYFSVKMTLKQLILYPTLSSQIEYVKQHAAEKYSHDIPQIVADVANLHKPFALTDMQQAYWVGRSDYFRGGGVTTHGYVEINADELDVARFEKAWRKLVAHHPMLRAVICDDGTQQILQDLPLYTIDKVDLQDKCTEEIQQHIRSNREKMSHQKQSLAQWPLVEIKIFLLPQNKKYVCLSFELIIGDASSWLLLFQQWKDLYDNLEISLPSIEISFRDYVVALQGFKEHVLYQKAYDYWQQRLTNIPFAPQLPLAKSIEEVNEIRFTRHSFMLEHTQWQSLQRYAQKLQLTPTAVILTAFAFVLNKFSETDEFTISLTLFNRIAMHPQVDDIAGDFTSLNLLAVDFCDKHTFAQQAQKIQQQMWDDYEHRYVSGVHVLRMWNQQHSRTPGDAMPIVFTSTLGLDQGGDSILGKLAKFGKIAYAITQTPQVWLDHQLFEENGNLVIQWDAIDALFPEGLITTMLSSYHGLLQSLAQGELSWQKLYPVPLPIEQQRIRDAINRATTKEQSTVLLHNTLCDATKKYRERIAIISEGKSFTYEDLWQIIAYFSAEINKRQLAVGEVVAVIMDKGWEQVVAVYAILQRGAIYVPLTPDDPDGRLRNLLDSSLAKLVMTQPWHVQRMQNITDVDIVVVSEERRLQDICEFHCQEMCDLAYVIYTSGSSGTPKGVAIEHAGVVNRICDVNERFCVNAADKIIALSSLCHDLSVYDIFGILAVGGCVVFPDAHKLRDPQHWAQLISQHKVTLWNTVPTFMQMFIEYIEKRCPDVLQQLRLVMLSGDWIPVDMVRKMQKISPETKIVSLGGATELSIWDICYEVSDIGEDWHRIPYGKPMSNTQYYILDSAMQDCPDWVLGEIYSSGVGVARAYWQNPQKTQQSFMDCPRLGRVYRSGDLGYYLPNGDIQIVGRRDFQVKIQGYRVELEEIRSVLLSHPEVSEAIVVARGEQQKYLLGYFTTHTALEEESLQLFIADQLPPYMIPRNLIKLDHFPKNEAGKIDSKALPEKREDSKPAVVSSTAQKIAKGIATILEVDHLNADENLLVIGATSLHIIRIANWMEEEFDFRPSIDDLYRDASAIAYANLLSQKTSSTNFSLLNFSKVPTKILEPHEQKEFVASRPGIRRDLEGKKIELHLPTRLPKIDLQERRSQRHFQLKAVSFEDFSCLLSCLTFTKRERYLYPSAGSLYPIQTYIYAKPGRIENIANGVYYYHPGEHALITISDKDIPANVYGRLVNRPVFTEGAFAIYLIVSLDAILPVYGEHSTSFCLVEAGYMGQLLMNVASCYKIGLCPMGDLSFPNVHEFFALQENQFLAHSFVGGIVDEKQEQNTQPMERLLHQIKNLSPSEIQNLIQAHKNNKGKSNE